MRTYAKAVRRLGVVLRSGFFNFLLRLKGDGFPAHFFALLRNGVHSTLCRQIIQVISEGFYNRSLTIAKLYTRFSRCLLRNYKMLCDTGRKYNLCQALHNLSAARRLCFVV